MRGSQTGRETNVALMLTRTLGTAVVFEFKDSIAKLRVDGLNNREVVFGLLIDKDLKRSQHSVGSELNFQVRGALITAYVEEIHRRRLMLRITAPDSVQIVRGELLTARL